MDLYTSLLRPILFSGIKVDPEWLHNCSFEVLDRLQRHHDRVIGRWSIEQLERTFGYRDERLTQTLWGLQFPNPFGLAAGFDKNGIAPGIWHAFGFGFAELGTVTQHPQPGNPKPRLFRLPSDRAALNRMGFNNRGCAALAERLKQFRPDSPSIPLGINLGKSKITPLAAAAGDYAASFRQLRSLGDYFVINVSSPNTPGLRTLQDATQLARVLDAVQQENQVAKPLLVKIAPDLSDDAIAEVLELARTYRLAGIVATNTTVRRDNLQTRVLTATGKSVDDEAGGISGQPLRNRATEVVRFIYQQTKGTLPIVGVGGIFTAEDAWEKILAGASLLQVYTGWIYEGPWQARRVLGGLSERLETSDFDTIAAAVGTQST
ncbi:dihydroorotate dehydrogenase, subfamily 2 [Rubidibacter lacunae KORDI 51-2]|uniref:Dihydroorotate dehydrogenase (quinone) n=1 Tax=Rubidibacter lacunae KORDI 51-2 TaxID=582515 RepID=U5DM03_9CHRO|nr:quinone-dependent dihydroorotate dehydrogenase [Rubidibacter lacunae]ERN40745.1 dihydroorotate dehydrogenase, subfamily 2 [Rubidibacter lacunae KORDI 51-2]